MSFHPNESTDHHLAVSLNFRPENILGRISSETTLYAGTFGGRQAAIKVSALKSRHGYTNTSWLETGFITKLDDHQNIIRHFYTTTIRDKSYIVTEFCAINLRDMITQDCGIIKNQITFVDLLRQITSGLAHIHKNNVIHCNLTPINILLNSRLTIKITNFELSLNVTNNVARASSTLADKIKEWTSPEILQWKKENSGNDQKTDLQLTTKMDVFNLGCIYYFVFSGGDHPFGARYERTQNILDDNPQYRKISNVPAEFKSFIFQLNKPEPEVRPNAMDILQSSCFEKAASVTQKESKQNSNINFSETDTLGIGSLRTTVFKGQFGGRDVAVKRIYNSTHFFDVENEIDILIKCEGHPNIVRYISSEKKPDCFLLALELCHKYTLLDWVDNQNCIPVKVERLEILRQVVQGLSYLHQRSIIHRDLKPSNILFFIQGNEAVVKIADFGISRLTFQGGQSRTFTFCSGTAGWTSPEMLIARNGQQNKDQDVELLKLTQKMDIFSLGCIFYFVLSNGYHPFGNNHLLQDYNISEGNPQFKETYDCICLNSNLSLIKLMVEKCPCDRPEIGYILSHPILWNSRRMIEFITQVSNFVHDTCVDEGHKLSSLLERKKQTCIKILDEKYFQPNGQYGPTDGWFVSLDDKLKSVFKENKRTRNQHRSMIKLVRLIRNFHNHYHEKSFEQAIRSHLGDIPDSFMEYWLRKFPTLIIDLKLAFVSLRDEECLKDFY